mgnify:CR=1 FL=1
MSEIEKTTTIDNEPETLTIADPPHKEISLASRESTMSSPEVEQVVAALTTASLEFAKVFNSKKAHHYEYAPLFEVIEAVRGPLAENGLAVFQRFIPTEQRISEMNVGNMETVLFHKSGQWIKSHYPVLFEKNSRNNASQCLGSGVTYARRYSILAALNLASEDDDGQDSGEPLKKNNKRKKPMLNQTKPPPRWDEKLKEVGLTEGIVNCWATKNNMGSWSSLSPSTKERIIKDLKSGILSVDEVKNPKTLEEKIEKIVSDRVAERKKGVVLERDKDFDAVKYAVDLKDCGYKMDLISAWCEAMGYGRPSSWEEKRRASFIAQLAAKKLAKMPPGICLYTQPKKGAKK